MSAIVVSGGHVLGSGGAVFATGSGGGGGTQINYAIATSTTTATVYLTVVGTYSLYRNDTLIASGQSSSTYNDTGLSANTTYTYSLTSGGGGFTVTTPVLDFANFAASDPSINTNSTEAKNIVLPGSVLAIWNGTGTHQATGAWYTVGQVNVQAFTTNFTFQMTALQQPCSFTGSISGTTLTVSAITGGSLQVGSIIGGNSNITAGTKITAFGSGSGGNGTYTVNISQSIGSEGMSGGANGGISFVVQNTTAVTQQGGFGGYGNGLQGDANACGYGGFAHLGSGQAPALNSVALIFDWYTSQGTDAVYLRPPNFFAFYVNGGPDINQIPHLDLYPEGIAVHNANVIAVNIVYDGTILTATIKDTVTNAQVRYSWPINIPACTQQNTAWVGFGGGSLVPVPLNILTWAYTASAGTRLAQPTFNVTAGHYTGTQTVTISGPTGASIYYSTNGLQPTSSSTLYTGPVTVSASTFLQAVAVQTGFTDSLVASANYVIQASGPTINFPSGFASAGSLIIPVGTAQLVGSNFQLTDNLFSSGANVEAGGICYVAPVTVSSFTMSCTLQAPGGASAGMAILFENQNQSASTGYVPAAPGSAPNGYGSGQLAVTGGPLCIAQTNTGLGCGTSQAPNNNGYGNGNIGFYSSVALAFGVSGNNVGVYLNGIEPTGSSTNITGGVSINNGNPFTVALTYSGTTLAMTITQGANVYTQNFTVDIPSVVGASTAFVHITGGNYANGIQEVTAWTGF